MRTNHRSSHILTTVALIVAGAAVASPVEAVPADMGETFIVDTLSDNPADGDTLREAVQGANANAGADTITFVDGLTGTLTMIGGTEMSIVESVSITGPGSEVITIDADDASRIFNSSFAGVDLAISGLTLTNGASGFPGGAINMLTGDSLTLDDIAVTESSSLGDGGALHVKDVVGNIEMTDVRFENNTSSGDGGALAINDASTASIDAKDVIFSGNDAVGGGEGGAAALFTPTRAVDFLRGEFVDNRSVGGDAGALRVVAERAAISAIDFEMNVATNSYGAAYIETSSGLAAVATGSTLMGNEAETGQVGAVSLRSATGDATLAATVSDNTAPSIGGAAVNAPNGLVRVVASHLDGNTATNSIGNLAVFVSSELHIDRSTIANGEAESSPGAFISQVSSTHVEKSTISGNAATADAANGGAGLSVLHGGNGKLLIDQSTLSGNSTLGEGGALRLSNIDAEITNSTIVDNDAAIKSGAIARNGVSTVAVDHSILTDNTAPVGPHFEQPIALDWSIVNPTPGVPTIGSDNQLGIDPKLGPLADNGGDTLTHLPDVGSPAIDAAAPNQLWIPNARDQRTFQRPVGIPDLGSVEVQPPVWVPVEPARIVDTRTNGETVDGTNQATGAFGMSEERTVTVAGRAGIPADAIGVVANVTAVNPESTGYLTVHPCVNPMPLAASLNYTAGVNLGNEVVIGLEAGQICVFSFASTDITLDVVGYVPAMSRYRTESPLRFLDTRANGVTFDGEAQAVGAPGAGNHVKVQIEGRSKARSRVMMYVAAVGATDNGFITIWDCVGDAPLASSLNYVAGVNRGNEVLAKLSPSGEVCVYTDDDVHVTIDVIGYISDHTNFTALDAPSRMLDTRANGQTVDDKFEAGGPTAAGGTLELDLGGRANIPADANTVTVNLTAIKPASVGFVTAYPCGSLPLAASLNYAPGVNGGNEIVASLDDSGTVCLFTSSSVHLTADVTGYTRA